MRIISIDPGYERLGVAILEKEAGAKERVIFSECFRTSPKLALAERLAIIGTEVARVIAKYKPQALAIETLFFAANKKTAIGVAEARGVVVYEAACVGLPVYEYKPNEIKVAVASHGSATKADVLAMTRRLVLLDPSVTSDDEVDAIAVGITHLATWRTE